MRDKCGHGRLCVVRPSVDERMRAASMLPFPPPLCLVGGAQVVTNMLFLDRPVLKKKLVDGPEVVSVIGGLPPLEDMLKGLYDCE